MRSSMSNATLYLVSQSAARRELLEQACIPFRVITPFHNEEEVVYKGDFHRYVSDIALHKMNNCILDAYTVRHEKDETLFFLTADTLIQTEHSQLRLGKPRDKHHARKMLQILQKEPFVIVTALCMQVYQWKEKGWTCVADEIHTSTTRASFIVPDEEIEWYLEKTPLALSACGATILEGKGVRYLTFMDGSYSSALGIDVPLLLHILKSHGFICRPS